MAEQANYYDIGVEQKIDPQFTLGLDTYYKQSHNLIDEGQFGAPIILTPFNYRYGKQYGAELTTNYTYEDFNAYLNLSPKSAKGKEIDSAQFNFSQDDLITLPTTTSIWITSSSSPPRAGVVSVEFTRR